MKLINFRLLFFAAAAVTASALVNLALIYEAYYILAFPPLLLAFVIYSTFASEKSKKTKYIITAALVCTAFLSFGAGRISLAVFNADIYGGRSVAVTARVTDDITVSASKITVIADNLKVDGRRVFRNASITLDAQVKVSAGDIITIPSCALNVKNFYSLNYRNNVKYFAEGFSEHYIRSGKPPLAAAIRLNVKDALNKGLSESQAGIAYALLFGDKGGMTQFETGAFSVAGLAHVLSVSGLHVSFLISCISALLKKLRVNRYARLGLIAVPIFLYCGLCGFSPSSLRAAIMGVYAAAAMAAQRKNDNLTSLSLAVILLLTVRPLFIADAGFQFSTVSVLAIFCLSGRFQKLFALVKIPPKLSSSISVTLSATIGVFPLMAEYFGFTALYSLLYNLILLPFVMAAYFLVTAVSLVAAVFPSAGVLYYVARPFLWFPELMVSASYKLPFAGQSLFGMGIFGGLYLACVFALSGYPLTRGGVRKVLTLSIALIMAVSAVAANIPAKPEAGVFASPGTSRILIYDGTGGTSCIIGGADFYDLKRAFEYLRGERRRHIDYLVLTYFKPGGEEAVALYNSILHFKAVLLADYDGETANLIKNAAGVKVLPAKSDAFSFLTPMYSGGDKYVGLKIEGSGKTFFITNTSESLTSFKDYDIVFFSGIWEVNYPVIYLSDEFKIKVN